MWWRHRSIHATWAARPTSTPRSFFSACRSSWAAWRTFPASTISGRRGSTTFADIFSVNLNENRVNTIVNIDNTGYRLWGVWTCDSDLLWQFVSVRRTADAINEALEAAYLEFVDRPFTKANLKFMIEAGRALLRTMELEGAILPGSDVWLLDSNTDTELAQGIVKLGVKFEPPAPMVDIRITSYRNIASYTLLLNQVAQEISGGTLAA
ncbi:phage tail sheath C-terminal domain-containing protein [Mesorhizobium sp. 8]|uniref:phage tail sheath C-terminal domain-containing protein n=1 Tax=Mesorhizobium sp. 8 TaxID=2584466 RepID=UPI001FEE2E79|nr:phage tail sheath C-terminal domain-containing protein [Mesorhizobium sp. 8]